MLDPVTQQKFDEQRYVRLKECVTEYLDEDGGTATKFLNDLQRALLENSQYFVNRVDEYTTVRDFFS